MKIKALKTKRIYMNGKKSRYCLVKVFKTTKEMRLAYRAESPGNIDSAEGAHHAYTKILIKKGIRGNSPETGTVYLHVGALGVGVVTHELLHALLWARGTTKYGYKEQYPIVIKNMGQEESLLYDYTYVVRQFYTWYWKTLDALIPTKK